MIYLFEQYQFSVTWMGHSQGRPSKTVRLVLGFDAETTAARWQTEFLKAIEHMAMLGQEAETPSPMPLPSGSPQSAMTEPIADREVDPNRPFRSFRDEEFHNEYLDHRKSATSYHDVVNPFSFFFNCSYRPRKVSIVLHHSNILQPVLR